MTRIDVATARRAQLVDVTAQVREVVRAARLARGAALVYCPHTTAGVTIQENADPTVKSDMLAHLSTLVPKESNFQHGEGNSDSHIKASLIGSSVTIVLDAGRLVLGHWQAVFFCEFDGPRQRQIQVKVLAG